MSETQPPSSARLDRALAQRDDNAFLQQLAEIDARFAVLELEDRPEPFRRFACLWILHQDVTMEGIAKYLMQSEGDHFGETLEYCEEIGAKQAVAYLTAVQGLCPRGRVPRDPDKRFALIDKLEARAAKSGDTDPLRALDERYGAAAMAELAQRMRAWVATHRAQLERDVDAATPTPPNPIDTSKLEQRNKALAEWESAANKKHEASVASLRAAAIAAGLIPWTSREEEKALARFIESASKLTERQWTTVAQRYHKSAKAAQKLLDRGFALTQQLRSGQLGDGKAFAQRDARHQAVIKKLFAITNQLPKQGLVGKQKVGLAVGASRAAAAGVLATRLHDWLALTPTDAELRDQAYGLFENLLPED